MSNDAIMRHLTLVACCLSTLSGCSLLGYYKYEKAEWVPPGASAEVNFPSSFEDGVHLTGPMMAALEVAMREFLPPGHKVKGHGTDKRLDECLSRRSTYETFVLQASDDLFFVRFSPVLKRCGLDTPLLDGGATYAIDGSGRIVDML
ncbi:hypothetical protein [Myxococcus sp. RHSTA-1-4]|uniref:hypothetical protein n=1 Tax=Myxococcus sp. RHSTA-1-4 TaxID=2874601 RepID=UPI001CBB3E77|nr:hypothetical protein [Myxococcus sp. RHSTA-1-4]MBZ4421427.1 hypothetical protein [Myxococcus sp. RHSTA-1-4]